MNTSFNVRGEPIVCTPDDAIDCFNRTNLDVLVLGDFVVERSGPAERSAPAGAPARQREGVLRIPLSESRRDWVLYACVWAVVILVVAIVVRREFVSTAPWWAVGIPPATLVIASLTHRRFSRAFYRGGMRVGGIVGHRVGQVLLALIHVLFVVPTAIALRIAGTDPLDRRVQRDSPTYWRAAPPPSPHDRLY